MISIINHGLGNFASVASAIEFLGEKPIITSDKSEIKKSDKIIIPGVGSFNYAMENLNKLNLIDVLNEEIFVKKKYILGICLGCQILMQSSEEGKHSKGLGCINGEVKNFNFQDNFPVPHVGWNEVKTSTDQIFKDLPKNFLMYFNHSYFPKLENKEYEIGSTKYSCNFTSVFRKKNIYGIQPHPEKSQKFGVKLLDNFLHHVS